MIWKVYHYLQILIYALSKVGKKVQKKVLYGQYFIYVNITS